MFSSYKAGYIILAKALTKHLHLFVLYGNGYGTGNMQKIIAVEATKSIEVLFALIGEILLFKIVLPSPKAWIGMLLVMFKRVLHSYHTS